jgi:hypothetical protein
MLVAFSGSPEGGLIKRKVAGEARYAKAFSEAVRLRHSPAAA